MATRKNTTGAKRRFWPRLLLAAIVIGASLLWFYGAPLSQQATVATSFGARVACSCRYIGGRSLGDCKKDFEPGMGLVFLTEDEANKSVTATVPFVSQQTAQWTSGSGCMLEKWDR